MTLSELKTITRAITPGAKPQVISDTVLTLMLNQGALDIASYTMCLKTNIKFDVVSDQQEYNLSTVVPKYLNIDKQGIWWNTGSKWKQLYPRTLKWLDENLNNWRDRSSGTPRYYAIEGDVVTIVDKPDTSLSNGFWIYYAKKPTDMTSDTHYPFSGSTTEYSYLSIFDMAICKYAKWQLAPMLSKEFNADVARKEYLSERLEKKTLLYRRKDIVASPDTKLQGVKI